jgi:hypothetical protein
MFGAPRDAAAAVEFEHLLAARCNLDPLTGDVQPVWCAGAECRYRFVIGARHQHLTRASQFGQRARGIQPVTVQVERAGAGARHAYRTEIDALLQPVAVVT